MLPLPLAQKVFWEWTGQNLRVLEDNESPPPARVLAHPPEVGTLICLVMWAGGAVMSMHAEVVSFLRWAPLVIGRWRCCEHAGRKIVSLWRSAGLFHLVKWSGRGIHEHEV